MLATVSSIEAQTATSVNGDKTKSILEYRSPAKQPVMVAPKPKYTPTINAKPAVDAKADPGISLSLAARAPQDASQELNQWITALALNSMPHTFTEDKDWGGTAERWDGISIRRDGLRLKTNRKKKTVKHGTWKKYSAQLRDPKNGFQIAIKQLRELPGDKVGFQIHCVADILVEGRQSKWMKGIQLYSLSADGHAKVSLAVDIELAIATDPKSFPPDLLFQPVVTKADLELIEFRVDHVGKVGGEIAQQVTRAVRNMLAEKIEDKELDLVAKLNKKINDKKDRLRVSVADALKSNWLQKTKEILPASVKAAID